MKFFKYLALFLLIVSVRFVDAQQPIVKFAAFGDYGKWYSPGEAMVSQMVHNWNPDFIITLGDNNYEYGADSTIDSNIGKYYHDFIHPYTGIFGNGASVNKFFPSLGNHDWISNSARPYLYYFGLPGNERYYDFVKGNCHFFAIDSDLNEPDGVTCTSVQALWLKNKLRQSTSRFKIVYFHHPPYSSGMHGNTVYMQWPFKEWGATVVLCGHEHSYERLVSADGMTYFINGLGGKDWRDFATIIPESRFRFTGNYGTMFVSSYQDSINFKFYAYPDSLKDDTTFVLSPIGIELVSELANDFRLEQNYPNPFNPQTKISFSLPTGGNVNLSIYDSKGELVNVLINDIIQAGEYESTFDASNLPSGVYFYKIISEGYSDTKKMILVK